MLPLWTPDHTLPQPVCFALSNFVPLIYNKCWLNNTIRIQISDKCRIYINLLSLVLDGGKGKGAQGQVSLWSRNYVGAQRFWNHFDEWWNQTGTKLQHFEVLKRNHLSCQIRPFLGGTGFTGFELSSQHMPHFLNTRSGHGYLHIQTITFGICHII